MLFATVTTETITLTVAIIGAVTGITGIGLSVWSLYRQIDQDRVKLRVGVSWTIEIANISESSGPPCLAISVTNISKFPITLSEVGLLLADNETRLISPEASTIRGETLPIRMESRTATTLVFPFEFMLNPKLRSARCGYASTDCGERIESKPGIIPKMVAEAQD